MTESRAAWLIMGVSAAVAAASFAMPQDISVRYLQAAVLISMLGMFAAIRNIRRPFGMAARVISVLLVAAPAVRGGTYILHIWSAAAWAGFLVFFCASVHRRWIDEVRHRYSISRLDRIMADVGGKYDRIRRESAGLQEEITLYQTVYDLATRQRVGMTRTDILAASSDSLKELARRRNFKFLSMNLFLMSGETVNLRAPGAAPEISPGATAMKDRMAQSTEPILQDGMWVGVSIRHQTTQIGDICLELDRPPEGGGLSPTDIKLLTATSDLMGLALQNSMLYEQVNQMAITDRLTGLFVLWYFKDRLKDETHRAMRSHRPLSVLMMDLDHFKKVNDTHGHLAGDAVLREASAVIKSSVREGDLVARYGGEEISAVLPDTDAAGAERVAERIRSQIESRTVDIQSTPLRVTISIGVNELTRTAASDDPNLTAARLLKGADEALYRAKHDGRNRVRTYQPAQALAAAPAPSGKD